MKDRGAVVLIGYGYWGKKIAQVLETIFSAVIIVDTGAVEVPANFSMSSLESALRDPRVQHCFIATPEETHFELSMKCLLSGKNIFVEKPLALTKNHAQKIILTALKKKKTLFTDYIFLYDPIIHEIKKALHSSVLGEVKQIFSYRWSKDFHKQGIEVTDDLLIHDLYISRFLFGEYELVKKSIRKTKLFSEAVVDLLVQGIPYVSSLRWTKDYKRDFQIRGTKSILLWEKNHPHDRLTIKNLDGKTIFSRQYTKKISPLEKSVRTFLETKSRDEQAMQKQYNEYLINCHTLELVRETNPTF